MVSESCGRLGAPTTFDRINNNSIINLVSVLLKTAPLAVPE